MGREREESSETNSKTATIFDAVCALRRLRDSQIDASLATVRNTYRAVAKLGGEQEQFLWTDPEDIAVCAIAGINPANGDDADTESTLDTYSLIPGFESVKQAYNSLMQDPNIKLAILVEQPVENARKN